MKISIIIIIVITVIIVIAGSASAQTPTPCVTPVPGGSSQARGLIACNGLISAPEKSSTGIYFNSGAAVVDPRAAFAPFKIPSYADLKSIYYDQAKSQTNASGTIIKHPPQEGNTNLSNLNFDNDTHLYAISGNLDISSDKSGSGNAIVFVENNLNITSNYTFGTPTTGTVFVVKGNVNIRGDANIAQNVIRIDAIIISSGIICTAADASGNCPSGYTETPGALVINGSLISIDQDPTHTCPANCPIRFRRTLPDNSLAAEVINHQVKYLVILRNTFSETLQRWSEIQ